MPFKIKIKKTIIANLQLPLIKVPIIICDYVIITELLLCVYVFNITVVCHMFTMIPNTIDYKLILSMKTHIMTQLIKLYYFISWR